MRRVALAYATSALVHGLSLGALLTVAWHIPWEYSVQRGEPIVLVASLGQTAPAAPEVVVETGPAEPPPPVSEVKPESIGTPRQVEDAPPPRPSDLPAPEPAASQVFGVPAPRVRKEDAAPPEPHAAPVTVARRTATPVDTPVATVADVTSSAPPSIQVLDAGAKVDQPPRKLPLNPAPEYPREARLAGWEGRVMLLATVNVSGLVEEVKVHESSGYAILDESALRTVRRWRFSAARRGLQPAAAEVLVPVRFSLRR